MNDTDRFADRAAGVWGGSFIAPRFISNRENAVYEVHLPQGRAALRLHRPGYHSRNEIQSELLWMDALAGRGFIVPRPIRTIDDELVFALDDHLYATVITWMSGAPIGEGNIPFSAPPSTLSKLYSQIGALLAQLHNETDLMRFPDNFSRPNWDLDGLVGADPLWGRYWEAPGLTATQRNEILAARDRAKDVLSNFDYEADTGLIHADALRENVFTTEHGLALIDFDDAGFGYRMYELASCLTQSVDEAIYPELVRHLLNGYTSKRPTSNRALALYPMFEMLRSFSALGWTITRLSPDHPKMDTYIRRATSQAASFLMDRSLD